MWRAKGKNNTIQLSFKYRIYPTKEVEEKFLKVMQIEAKVYNALLDAVNNARKEGRKITPEDTQDMLKGLKIDGKDLVYSKALQMVNNQLWYNINALHELKRKGKKVGKLRHKKIMKIINYNQSGFKVEGDKLILSKIGEMRVLFHRPLEGKVKGVIIKKSATGWYAVFQVEVEKKHLDKAGKVVGVDLGVDKLVTTSDGVVLENPKVFDKVERGMKILQRSLSRKKRGSRNYEKVREKLVKLHEHAKNLMSDFIHKVTSWLVEQYDEVYVEDLDVKEMVEDSESKTLRKHILHSNLSRFMSYLSYKAERAGRRVVKVNPAYTSKTCARCGYVKKDLSLADRVFACPNCGWSIDRDYNASLNILHTGSGLPLEPVDRRPLLYIPFSEGVYSKFPGRSRKSPSRGGDAPS
ncbi:RNA-guided endonuclease InsQ/TnpB family protein [Metallosphaera hakonensis]|uniref:Transposase n=1 Tax=Metallosphaera hakonensis JCM 8857 = DSM 7519 TaxID=1293036 RepID=A0A2U9IS31_9CREN|nr:RNA-guided endonuclease TnpB family protein [Metallosphaera hakonensis]AWR98842.1 IS200/IS605 family element transposase accessory protein TnpB [Metallosphaera hakonensis JCM 8857 = DSM 7519]